ncbi:PfkB domain protein [Cellulomonas flavigena DSM 20109]|uniref:PfkB domain protein n=1 Tax=Cellulomonas flavigena (strain ATCC 482 / DSM 20109 / BCRC 11376 / JCM 18109 / NBRC 3775 / NCIMB 8073 / NRS 134) TaxID=446466 RepID=D5UGJ5_CELFN|nr:PfkB family carbohydrate kinase [Cellulomonas flavigena]ADG73178.1 PfkB domain protein [Cellulomonas flavigena DSM 20109]
MVDVVVLGQVGRDLVVRVDAVPAAGEAAPVRERVEVLGGKGANQGVACAQLGLATALVGVVGDDRAADAVLERAVADGMDVGHVVRRAGATTALLLDVVADGGERRLLEHVPDDVLLRPDDVRAAAGLVGRARAVLLQLQQPADALAPALGTARDALLVADGAPQDEGFRDTLLDRVHVLRADEDEAALLLGDAPDGVDATVAAAHELVGRGPRVVALEAGDANVVAWAEGHVVVPLLGGPPVDPTGGGDSFVAGLVAALLAGHDAATAAWWASTAAAATASRLGGRPDLDVARVAADAARHRREHETGH